MSKPLRKDEPRGKLFGVASDSRLAALVAEVVPSLVKDVRRVTRQPRSRSGYATGHSREFTSTVQMGENHTRSAGVLRKPPTVLFRGEVL